MALTKTSATTAFFIQLNFGLKIAQIQSIHLLKRYFWGMKGIWVFTLLLCSSWLHAQFEEIKYASDFELNGRVERCEVLTPYGREILRFNPDQSLKQITTIFNEEDQEVVTFKYDQGALKEKSIEVLKGGELQPSLSFYHTYTQNDSITEEIVFSFDGQFQAQNRKVSESRGTPKTLELRNKNSRVVYRYEFFEGATRDSLSTYLDQDLIRLEITDRSVKTEVQKTNVVYTDSLVASIQRKVYDRNDKLLREVDSIFDPNAGLVDSTEKTYSYREGLVAVLKEMRSNQTKTKRFIYQLDNHVPPNWVKRIEQPSNDYITRIITYFDSNDSIPR